jgi:hypothetical protein
MVVVGLAAATGLVEAQVRPTVAQVTCSIGIIVKIVVPVQAILVHAEMGQAHMETYTTVVVGQTMNGSCCSSRMRCQPVWQRISSMVGVMETEAVEEEDTSSGTGPPLGNTLTPEGDMTVSTRMPVRLTDVTQVLGTDMPEALETDMPQALETDMTVSTPDMTTAVLLRCLSR